MDFLTATFYLETTGAVCEVSDDLDEVSEVAYFFWAQVCLNFSGEGSFFGAWTFDFLYGESSRFSFLEGECFNFFCEKLIVDLRGEFLEDLKVDLNS